MGRWRVDEPSSTRLVKGMEFFGGHAIPVSSERAGGSEDQKVISGSPLMPKHYFVLWCARALNERERHSNLALHCIA